LKTDKTYTRGHRSRIKNGDIRWVQELSLITCDETYRAKHITGVLMDITDQQKREKSRLTAECKAEKYLRAWG